VSHLKQRKEKSCLNCNATINGRYCSICGQENLEPQESVWHLIVHFFNDITHFDGKFFSSVKYVVTKPGFLSSEYIAGRRMSYLNPVRFYVFTSFIFFLILFSFFIKEGDINLGVNDGNTFSKKDSLELIKDLKEVGLDSSKMKNEISKYVDSVILEAKKDTVKRKSSMFHIADFRDRKEYDSLSNIGKVKDGFLKKMLMHKQFQMQQKYGDDAEKQSEALKENVMHYTPQVLFLTLPFFALLLKILYVRRKKYYYVAHAIFTIHFYIFIYIQLLLINIFNKLSNIHYLSWLNIVVIILSVSIVYYLYRAMRVFYEQSRRKTILKIIILTFSLVFLFLFFMILLFGFSLYKM
jgi:Protein of unknown function (DUF3667)